MVLRAPVSGSLGNVQLLDPLRQASSRSSTVNSAWGVTAVFAATLAGVLGLATGVMGTPDASNRLRDDAFYEFAWAANVAAGLGPTVSDGVTTSGVQLLWSLFLVPCVWLFGAAALPIVAPWFGFVLHVITAGLWFRGCKDRLTGFCIAGCWLGHPLLVRESQNGQETALACLLASVLWLRRAASERAFLLCSCLAVLARSDLLAFVVALSVWRHRRCWWRAVLTPAIALTVHVLANALLGGGLWPDSAMPMAWLWHANQAVADPSWSGWWQQAWWFLRPTLLGGPWAMASAMGLGFGAFVLVRPWWPPALRAFPAAAVGCAYAWGARDLATPAWMAMFLALLPAARPRRVPRLPLALLAGLLGIVVLHWAVRWYPRDYYLAPLVVAALAVVAAYGRSRLLLVVLALAQVADRDRVRAEPLAGQVEMAMAGQFLANVLPTSERIGCFNSGLVTWYAAVMAAPTAHRGVVNLDGVVNASSFAALRERRLDAWLDAEGIRFVLDNPVQFALDPRLPHAVGHWFGPDFDPANDLVEVARFDAPGLDNGRPGGDSMRLYWRRGRGALPIANLIARDLGRGPGGARFALWPARPGEQLQVEGDDGHRHTLLSVDVPTTVIVRLPGPGLAAANLFVAGRVEPVLRLPAL